MNLEELAKSAAAAQTGMKSTDLDSLARMAVQASQKTAMQTPQGYAVAPGTTQEQAARIPPGMVYDPNTGGYIDAALAAQRMGAGQGAAATFIAGAPFVGEYFDEATGKIMQMQGRSPEIGQEIARQSREQFREAMPKTATALEVGGGIVGSLPLVASGAGLVQKGAGLLQKSAIGLGLGVFGGGIEGAVSGYGAGEGPEGRKEEATKRGVFGAGVGGLLGAAAPLFGAAAKSVVRRIKRLDVATIAEEFGTDRKTANVIKSFLVNDDLDAATRRLADLGEDAMLADAGIGTGQALDVSMSTGGRALRVGREAIEERSRIAGRKLASALDDVLGTPTGVKTAARDISQRTAAVRQKAYDAAYRQPIDYAARGGRKIEAVLERVPPRTLNSAIQEANDAMQEAGLRNLQIMAQVADDGSVVFREMPNVQQLDFLKRALGDIAQSEVDDFGRLTGAGIRANRLAGDLRDAIGEAAPAYKRAVKLGGDKIAEDNALRIGKDILTRRVKLEDVRDAMRGASVEAKQAAKRGLREGIEETLSNVRRTISDPNVDAREAMQLVKEMSSRANRAKLRQILGQSETDRLLKELDRTAAALELRAVVATNSKTAVRQAGQGAVEQATEAGPVGALMQAKPAQAAQKMIQELTGATDAATVARREDIFAQIAEALTRKRGREAQKALETVRRAMQGQPIRDEEAAQIVKAAGVPLVSGLYQSGMQVLERQ